MDCPREEHSRQKEEAEESPEARACWLGPGTEKRSIWLKGLTSGIRGNEVRKHQMADDRGPKGHCKALALP